jgi:hypothetical protein
MPTLPFVEWKLQKKDKLQSQQSNAYISLYQRKPTCCVCWNFSGSPLSKLAKRYKKKIYVELCVSGTIQTKYLLYLHCISKSYYY